MAEKVNSSPRIVVDASLILCLLFPDEKKASLAKRTLSSYERGEISFCAPTLLAYEVANGLKSAVARKRVNLPKAKRLLKLFLKLKIDYLKPDFNQAFNLANQSGLSLYDASYLALCQDLNLPLLSLDQTLNSKYTTRVK